MQVSALHLFKTSENVSYWSRLIKAQLVLYCIVFVVLNSKYGENENILRKKEKFCINIALSKYYLLLKTRGHIANQSEAFHN